MKPITELIIDKYGFVNAISYVLYSPQTEVVTTSEEHRLLLTLNDNNSLIVNRFELFYIAL